jgi:spore germination protein GerM
LYYVAEDGMSLVLAQREVAFGEPVVEQARFILEAQLAAVQAPVASAVPAGTTLKAIYVTERGEAFVDLSAEITANHPGGALEELFTVYTIVNALTVNLPAITQVQILVGGKEADTLAGHVDLRQPLIKNLTWVKTDNPS